MPASRPRHTRRRPSPASPSLPRTATPLGLAVLVLALGLLAAATAVGQGRVLEFEDLMKLRTIDEQTISEDGTWIAWSEAPDRGDGRAVAREVDGETRRVIERGTDPALSADAAWLAALVAPSLEEQVKAEDAPPAKQPKPGLALVRLADGERIERERVRRVAFSPDGAWVAWHHHEEPEDDGEEETTGETAPDEPEGGEPAIGEERTGERTTASEETGAEEPAGEEMVPESAPGASPEPSPEEPPAIEPPTGPEPEEEPTGEEQGSEEQGSEEQAEAEQDEADDASENDGTVGTTLVLRHLATGAEVVFEHVESWAFDETGRHLALARAVPGGGRTEGDEGDVGDVGDEGDEGDEGEQNTGAGETDEADEEAPANGLLVYDLTAPGTDGVPAAATTAAVLDQRPRGRYPHLAWTHEDAPAPALAFVAAREDEHGHLGTPATGDGEVWIWSAASGLEAVAGAPATGATPDPTPEGWYVPATNELAWSRDGERLFFGFKPEDERPPTPEEDEKAEGNGDGAAGDGADDGAEEDDEPFDPYDLDALLEDRQVDVWHWNDPLIVTNQKEIWEQEVKRVYLAVHHRGDGRVVPLADRTVRTVIPTDNPRRALAVADVPYLEERTWDGFYQDLYLVDLADGSTTRVAERLSDPSPALSPSGRRVVWWEEPHWRLHDATTGTTRILTEGLGVPFANEDDDYPAPDPGYGSPVWVENRDGTDRAVLLRDKFDLWRFPVADDPAAAGEPVRLTEGVGRANRTEHAIVTLDPEEPALEAGAGLLVVTLDERDKTWGLVALREDRPGLTRLAHGPHRFRIEAKAEDADRLLYTRESYTEFPDLWVADMDLAPESGEPTLAPRRKLSDVNPEIADYAWGSAELVEWTSADGEPLQGVLIKPGDYREGERYPVLVYFYRFFSQRLHEFNEPVVNHRPSFPVYASRGYAVFLPDVRFEIGEPGSSATRALVPGVQKLVDMGVADPDAIGLHGHSWSGYQTAFVITETDLFAAAVAGAPVTNMTSAYGGIRWGSGLARMFQYEQGQSRIGASLWEAPHLYVENSPLFYADRIDTPLLMQFGDADGAVPWTQGIELYLALRRLDKPVVFLQYRDEPHHLQQTANKLDYSIKMLEFFDHHLKGAEAPTWWSEGVPYQGK